MTDAEALTRAICSYCGHWDHAPGTCCRCEGGPIVPIEQAAEAADLDVDVLREVVRHANISRIAWQEVDAELNNLAAAYAAAMKERT